MDLTLSLFGSGYGLLETPCDKQAMELVNVHSISRPENHSLTTSLYRHGAHFPQSVGGALASPCYHLLKLLI
jgi:hypothetical protein